MREIAQVGGDATAIPVDVRDFGSIQRLVDETVKVSIVHRWVNSSANRIVEIWSPRCPSLQLWRDMVGLCRKDTNETIPAHAANQPRGAVWGCAGSAAVFRNERMERAYHRCQPSHIL